MTTRKLKTYRVWTHYDTGVQQRIKASSEDKAAEKAEENLDSKDFNKQLMSNLQRGETDAEEDNG